jgi:ATP-dependent helicase HrpB
LFCLGKTFNTICFALAKHSTPIESRMTPILPIVEALPDLLAALTAHNRVVLEAPPGAGKTTAVPLALLSQPWLNGKKILMLEPRRIAARSAALFMAGKLQEQIAQTVGYRIRFENQVSKATRIEVITEGILTRLLQSDPALEDVGIVIFDEFHERHLHSDLALALCLDAQTQLREDLRILVMSATLDGARLSEALGAQRITSAGKSYPVTVRHLPPPREESIEITVARGIRHALESIEGDVLVFLPGRREIERTASALADLPSHIEVHALHGELTIDAQSAAIRQAAIGQRKVVLATNVAESSLTLPGVRAVVDSGLAREPKFNPNSGFSTLTEVWISQASATQRAGRAGRVAEGLAIRLWSESKRLEMNTRPEILRADLAPLALEIAAWGSSELNFIDAPPAATLAQANQLLQSLGLLDRAQKITQTGKRCMQLGTHPRLANMLARARGTDLSLACDLIALLEARDVFKGHERFRDDWQARWQALQAYRTRTAHGGDGRALAAIDHAAKQWAKRVQVKEIASSIPAHGLGDVLLHAFPDRVAKVRSESALRYSLSNGRGGEIAADSMLRGETWLVVSELDGLGADARIRRAAPFDEVLLQQHYGERLTQELEQKFDAVDGAVKAREIARFDQLTLSEKMVPPKDATSALCIGIRSLGLACLPWTDNLKLWLKRAQSLKSWLPAEHSFPDLSDALLLDSLELWLGPFLQGKSRLSHLQSDLLANALTGLLSFADQQLMDQQAPKSLTVPSGMTRALDYDDPSGPVLAVKLQELFGLAQTPRVALGRIPVTLQLLSPGGKPVQVTKDLKNFWDNTYTEVRKELKGRYPRHPWPDDPWNAPPTHRAKPRGT